MLPSVAAPADKARRATKRPPAPRAFRDLPANPYHEIWDHCDETRLTKPPAVDFPFRGPWLPADTDAAWDALPATWNLRDAAPAPGDDGFGSLACF